MCITEGSDPLFDSNEKVISIKHNYSKLINSRFTIIGQNKAFFLEKNGLYIHIGMAADYPLDDHLVSNMRELGISVLYQYGFAVFSVRLIQSKVFIRGPSYILDRAKTVYGLLLQTVPGKHKPVFDAVFPNLVQFLK